MAAPQTMHQQIVEGLGRRIVGGEYEPGSYLPREEQLCEQLGVSRVVVREAVKVLEAMGILDVRPKRGTRVLPMESWNTLDRQVLHWVMAGKSRDRGLRDLMEFRRIIEPSAVRLAVDRITDEQVAIMETAFAEMEHAVETGDTEAYVDADLRFHETILIAANNLYLLNLRGAITRMLHQSFSISSRAENAERLSLPLHRDLLMGLKRRDPVGALAAVDRLIARAEQNLEQWFVAESSNTAVQTAKGAAS